MTYKKIAYEQGALAAMRAAGLDDMEKTASLKDILNALRGGYRQGHARASRTPDAKGIVEKIEANLKANNYNSVYGLNTVRGTPTTVYVSKADRFDRLGKDVERYLAGQHIPPKRNL